MIKVLLYKPKEAAALLNISTDQLKKLREDGLIAGVKIGRGKIKVQYRYSEFALRRFIQQQEAEDLQELDMPPVRRGSKNAPGSNADITKLGVRYAVRRPRKKKGGKANG